MAREIWFVIDHENYVTWNDKTEKSERFSSQKAALKRACEIADSEPGTAVFVCKALKVVCADVLPSKVYGA